MKTEDIQQNFFDLYSQSTFETLKAEEQAFVIDHFSIEEYNQLRSMHLNLSQNTDDELDLNLLDDTLKEDVLDFVIKEKKTKVIPFYKQGIPLYKVAMMLVFAVSLGLFSDQIFNGLFIDSSMNSENMQLAVLDSTLYKAIDTIQTDCTDIAIISENMTTVYTDHDKAISTVSTCEIKEIFKHQPKKIDSKMIDDFPLVSF